MFSGCPFKIIRKRFKEQVVKSMQGLFVRSSLNLADELIYIFRLIQTRTGLQQGQKFSEFCFTRVLDLNVINKLNRYQWITVRNSKDHLCATIWI